MFEEQFALAKKAMYATIGAPVVATQKVKDYRGKVAERYGKLADNAEKQFDAFAAEGEKFAKKLQSGDVVEEIQSRVDLEKVQDRVEKLRDQLEGALHSWRESFAPAEPKTPAKKVPVEKTTAKKAPAKTTAKKAPAKTTAKKAPAKTTPAKTTAKKTPATATK